MHTHRYRCSQCRYTHPYIKIHTQKNIHTQIYIFTHRYTQTHKFSHTDTQALSQTGACTAPSDSSLLSGEGASEGVLPKAVEGSSTETANSTLDWGLKPCSSVSTKVWCSLLSVTCARTHLLLVLFGVGQHGGHVEHDLVALVESIDRVDPRGVICKTGARTERAQRTRTRGRVSV